MFFRKKKKNNVFYAVLVIALIALILAILGFTAIKDMLFPLLLSAIWHFFLKFIKNTIRNMFFSD